MRYRSLYGANKERPGERIFHIISRFDHRDIASFTLGWSLRPVTLVKVCYPGRPKGVSLLVHIARVVQARGSIRKMGWTGERLFHIKA